MNEKVAQTQNCDDFIDINVDAPKLSVVVPCFNEAAGIDALYCRVTETAVKEVGQNYEFILVDDGSIDATWSEICNLSRQDANVIGVKLSRNYGHQLALTAGLSIARGSVVFILDADLQDPPELLSEMMTKVREGADVVYGQRRHRSGETWFKTVTAKIFYRTIRRLVDIEIPVDTGDFRLMTRRAVQVLNEMPEQHRFVRGMVSWIGMKQVPVVYDRSERVTGTTKYTLGRMIRFALDAISSFSIQPLRIASLFGVIFGVFGLVVLSYTLYSWSLQNVIRGWTSVMSVVLILGSVQLFVLGVFGEYMGRLYLESKRRPLFVIDKVVRSSNSEAIE